MKNSTISADSLRSSISQFGHKLQQYSFLIFFIFLAAIYGFILYRINVLANATPSEEVVTAATSKTPHIDQHVVTQLQNLKDNSVSVKTLFDEARDNPFQE